MSDEKIINLLDRKPPSCYTINIAHHYNDTIEFYVQDVSDDPRSIKSVAYAMVRIALHIDPTIEVEGKPNAREVRKLFFQSVRMFVRLMGDEIRRLSQMVTAYLRTNISN